MMYPEKKSLGFTLIELLVVISIIGVLASVVLASLQDARAKARNANMVAILKQVESAVQMYWLDNDGTYPHGSPVNVGWDCIGTYSDNYCWNNDSIYDVNTNFNSAMSNYYDIGNIIMPTYGGTYEGMMYRARNLGKGYEVVYVLEGYDASCGAGYRRGTSAADEWTICTFCGGNWTGATVGTNYCQDQP